MDCLPPIILIDDNRPWRETLAEFFRARGFKVRTMADPGQALAIVRDLVSALVVCDYHMPQMSGLEFIERLSVRDNLAILILSSDDDPTLPERALRAGANAFLLKNISPAILLARVRQLAFSLDRRWGTIAKPWQWLLPSPTHTVRRLFYRPTKSTKPRRKTTTRN